MANSQLLPATRSTGYAKTVKTLKSVYVLGRDPSTNLTPNGAIYEVFDNQIPFGNLVDADLVCFVAVGKSVNPALQAQLDLLGRTLAAKNNQPAALFGLPKTVSRASTEPPLRAAEGFAEAFEPLLRRETAAQPLKETLASFSARQVARVADVLKPLALRIYGVLNLLGCTVASMRGYHRKASQVSYFCPAEAIYTYLSITRGSFYRSLKELIALGLVAARGHKTTLNGWAVRCDGTLWAVKLLPRQGTKAKLRFDDLKARYRDLAADIESGKTVWRQMRQSYTHETKPVEFKVLVDWALTPHLEKSPVTLTVASENKLELEILLDVPGLPKQGRRAGVDRAAQALAQHLGDASSLNFYRHLVWQLLRLSQQGRGYFSTVYQMLVRIVADLQEGFARKAGALFVSRLKGCDLWAELKEVPLTRIAA